MYGVTHVEKAPLGLRRAMEMLITGEMLKNISALHRIIGENLVEFTRLKQKVASPNHPLSGSKK